MSYTGRYRRHRCVRCRHMTTKWESWNGGPYACFDGCFSTTGRDYRTMDGQPAWLPFEKQKAWDPARLWVNYWKKLDAEAAERNAAKTAKSQAARDRKNQLQRERRAAAKKVATA